MVVFNISSSLINSINGLNQKHEVTLKVTLLF